MYQRENILKAINNGRLSLKNEGERFWYKYKLRITILHWSRNLFDGYQIEVFDKKTNFHLDTVVV